MTILNRIKNYLENRKAHKNWHNYVDFLKKKGVKIGKNFYISGGTLDKNIDLTRPSLITIGDNVSINKNFTLMTHDFVSGVFLYKLHDFLPSSGRVTIGNNVRFGANCTVLKGVTIGDNCFIGAGSVVSSDIPSNSMASGNPCKVVCDIDSYYRIRKEACKPEAYIYAQSIVERFGRKPEPSDFWEEFPLFVDSSNIDQYPQIPIRRQLKTSYEEWILNHKAPFKTFDEFLDHALAYDPSKHGRKTAHSDVSISSEIKDEVRAIVSSCIEHNLNPEDDATCMDDIEGWTSLTNMMILAEIEKHYKVAISAEDMFNMVSVQAISEIVQRIKSVEEGPEYKNIAELYPHSPLWSAICVNVEKTPKKVAVKCGSSSISYSTLYRNVCKAAHVLNGMGIKHGDKIILSAHKEIEYLYIYFACHILGVTTVIVDAESNAKRLRYIEDKIQPKHCFGYKSDKFASSEFNNLKIEHADMLQKVDHTEVMNTSDISEILFTTGTTGNPKGVCLSYANIYGSACNINEFIQNISDDIELIGLPICHSFGMGRIRCNLLKGATVVIVGSFANVQKIFKTIEDEHITGFGIVPAAWAYIKKTSGDRIGKYSEQIRYIEIGSATMSLETKQEILNMFPTTRICMHYGLTEASRSAFQEFHDIEHLTSIGRPVTKEVEIRIFDNTGKEVPKGQSGELCVKGNMVMTHYLNPTDNNNAFYGDYFRTGDNGYIGVDGYLYLLGREKEIINVGGKKVSPMEIEDIICSIGVGDCVCVPMKDPEGVMGELVKCYVLKDSTSLTFDQIRDSIVDRLETYKRPVEYAWIDEIPVTSSGKKQRVNLR